MADEIKIEKNERDEYILKMDIGGQVKDMVVDTGFSGEIFVDAANFEKVKGKEGKDVSIIDATGRKSTAGSKTEVPCKILDLDVTVDKRVLGLKRGGANLVGAAFFPNLKGKADATLDLVNGVLVIKKVEKVKSVKPVEEKPIKVPFRIPEEKEEVVRAVEEKPVRVPFEVSPERREF